MKVVERILLAIALVVFFAWAVGYAQASQTVPKPSKEEAKVQEGPIYKGVLVFDYQDVESIKPQKNFKCEVDYKDGEPNNKTLACSGATEVRFKQGAGRVEVRRIK